MSALLTKVNVAIQNMSVAPHFTQDELDQITEIVFYAPKARPSDVLLVFGAPVGDWGVAADAYRARLAKHIVASGGVHERTKDVSEADLIKNELVRLGVPEAVILTDSTPTNTLENVTSFMQLLVQHGIGSDKILYLTIYHHSGRCYLTLKKQFPNSTITAINHGLLWSGLDIQRHNWTASIETKLRVYGEYRRIMEYSEKGDIESPNSIS